MLGLSQKQTPAPWELSLEPIQTGCFSNIPERADSKKSGLTPRLFPWGPKESSLANLGNIKVSSFLKVDREVSTACPLMKRDEHGLVQKCDICDPEDSLELNIVFTSCGQDDNLVDSVRGYFWITAGLSVTREYSIPEY